MRYYERRTPEPICRCGHELFMHVRGGKCQATASAFECLCTKYERAEKQEEPNGTRADTLSN